ncbi:MAG: iron-sulfur cluster assembly protein [Candidatus Gottesmanbacteria bacterium]
MVQREHIVDALRHIPDPELGISIWDLGLIYDLHIDPKGNIEVVMTLTSVGCPLFGTIQSDIEEHVKKVKGVKKVTIELTFEPPWSVDRMTDEARAQLGM